MNNHKSKSKNIKNMENLRKRWCKFCTIWKKKEDYSLSNGKCKECRRKHEKQRKEKEIKEIGLAGYLLKNSCAKAFYRCGKKQGYENVECAWSNFHDMYNDLKNKEQFWKEWQKQTRIYEEWGYLESERPTLDRIDNKKHYSLDNIQCLSLEGNRLKAKNAATHVFFTDENGVFSYKTYDTVKKAAANLNVDYEKLRRNRDVKRSVFINGEQYFIQSAK
ncbi:hypothetical protein ACE41A_02440 [Bacillus cytotoxicus]|uniref:hypothetical protein n=1 Tax=Bacillus cytotoxicus TaxID=580165 RepID=UPI0035CA7D99